MPWSAHTFPMRDHVGLPRPLTLPSLPTKANFNPDQVFPVPPSGHDFLLFSDGSKSRGRVGAAFVHLHPTTGSIIGSHLLPLPSYMSVFDAELYAASCALQYAANCVPRHDTEPPSHPQSMISLSIDNQATISTISRPGYSYLAPLLHDIRKATANLHLSGSSVQVGWTPSHTGITGDDLGLAGAVGVGTGMQAIITSGCLFFLVPSSLCTRKYITQSVLNS